MYLLIPQDNNQSDFILPGSFTDPRPTRPTREEVLVDLSQLNEQFSSSPKNSSGVVMRNSGGSSNSRPSSLLLELETLEEDESTPSPSPQVKKNPATLFDFDAPSNQDATSDGTISPLAEDLRDRSGSADTLTYEDPSTPTPTESGENISIAQTGSSEVKSSVKENLIDLSLAGKDNGKTRTQLSLAGLKDALDEDEDDGDDESSSLLAEEKEGLAMPLPEEKPSGSKEDLLGSSCESNDFKFSSLDSLGDLKMGQVICIGDKKTGRVRYIGPTEFAPGVWIGVELDTPSGKGFCDRAYFVGELSCGSIERT